jgi:hypothetical protein
MTSHTQESFQNDADAVFTKLFLTSEGRARRKVVRASPFAVTRDRKGTCTEGLLHR